MSEREREKRKIEGKKERRRKNPLNSMNDEGNIHFHTYRDITMVIIV